MGKQIFEIDVEIDEVALAILGWEGKARMRVTADDWETEDPKSPKIHYSYALSATFRFNLEEWNTRYRRSGEHDYTEWLLLEIRCQALGEPIYKEILTDHIRKVQRRPLRVSIQEDLGYSLPSVNPEQITARITAYDEIDVSQIRQL